MNRTIQLVLTIVIIPLLIGMIPALPYCSGTGYFNNGGVGLLLLIVLIVLLVGGGRGK